MTLTLKNYAAIRFAMNASIYWTQYADIFVAGIGDPGKSILSTINDGGNKNLFYKLRYD